MVRTQAKKNRWASTAEKPCGYTGADKETTRLPWMDEIHSIFFFRFFPTWNVLRFISCKMNFLLSDAHPKSS